MTLRNARRAPFVTLTVFAAASSAVAGASPEDEARRLDDRQWFVHELGRGWEPLLADVDQTLTTLASAPAESLRPVRVTADAVRETVAKSSEARGEAGEPRALQLYEVLAESAVDESRREGHHRSAAG